MSRLGINSSDISDTLCQELKNRKTLRDMKQLGHQMARQGRAGVALGIAAIGSFIAGTVGVLGLMLVAPPLAKFFTIFYLGYRM